MAGPWASRCCLGGPNLVCSTCSKMVRAASWQMLPNVGCALDGMAPNNGARPFPLSTPEYQASSAVSGPSETRWGARPALQAGALCVFKNPMARCNPRCRTQLDNTMRTTAIWCFHSVARVGLLIMCACVTAMCIAIYMGFIWALRFIHSIGGNDARS